MLLLVSYSTKKRNPVHITYRFLPEATLSLSEPVEAFDLTTNAALQLSDLLRCAGNTGNCRFDGGITNFTDRNRILQHVLLNGREEVHRFSFFADSTFDPWHLPSASILQVSGRVTGIPLRKLNALQPSRMVSHLPERQDEAKL